MSSPAGSPRAVVFDLDGTLADSMPFVLRAFAHAIEPWVGIRPEAELFAALRGPADRCLEILLRGPHHVPEASRRLHEFSRGHEDEVGVFAGAVELLGELRARGRLLGLWTGRDRRGAERILAANGLADFFAAVVCGDDFATHKPDPEGLRAVLASLEVAPDAAVLAGDADVDVLGAHAAGTASLLIEHGRVVDPAVRRLATRRAASPAEAYAVLLAWTAEG